MFTEASSMRPEALRAPLAQETLSDLVLSALAREMPSDSARAHELNTLLGKPRDALPHESPSAQLARILRTPSAEDRLLLGLAHVLGLSEMELLVVTLAMLVETRMAVGR